MVTRIHVLAGAKDRLLLRPQQERRDVAVMTMARPRLALWVLRVPVLITVPVLEVVSAVSQSS